MLRPWKNVPVPVGTCDTWRKLAATNARQQVCWSSDDRFHRNLFIYQNLFTLSGLENKKILSKPDPSVIVSSHRLNLLRMSHIPTFYKAKNCANAVVVLLFRVSSWWEIIWLTFELFKHQDEHLCTIPHFPNRTSRQPEEFPTCR